LAIFWIVTGVLVQIFWNTVQPHMVIPVNREVMGVIFFILFSYNFVRWRMSRMLQRTYDDTTEPPRPRVVHKEYDPTFDFSRDEKKDEPPV
jgi:hypothetical protein